MTTIKLRRGTAAEWATANPVLNDGEVGFERDTNKHKIGDGVTIWNSLNYFVDDETIGNQIDTVVPVKVIEALAADSTPASAAAAAVDAALVSGGQKKLALDKISTVTTIGLVQNDFPNPGAEYDTSPLALTQGGGTSCTPTRDTTGWKSSGVASWKIVYTSTSTATYAQSDVFVVAPGQPVAVSAKLHNDHVTDAKTLRILCRWLASDGSLITTEFASQDVAAGSTVSLSKTFQKAPPLTAGVRICFQRYSGASAPASGDTFHADNVFVGIGQLTVPVLPLDGDRDNAYWLGTAGQSASKSVPPLNLFPDYPDPDLLVTWGDSLSSTWENAANGVPVALSGRWPTYLASTLGMRHAAGGVSGDGDKGIAARMGAVPMLISPVTIAASGYTIVTPTQNTWKDNSDGAVYISDSSGQRVMGYLDNDTDGSVTGSTGAWYFYPAKTGTSVTLVGPTVRIEPLGPNGTLSSGVTRQQPFRAAITTIESRNIYYYMDSYSTEQAIDLILSRYRNMVDFALHSSRSPRVIVLEIPASYNAADHTSDESPGTPRRTFLDSLNSALKNEFRPYWCSYVSEWLLTSDAATHAGISFTTQDNTDITNGIVPTVFRQDTIHYSDKGGQEIAYYIYKWMQRRGWVA